MTAVTAVVTAHGVKRSRPARPGAARGPTRRGVPARRGRPDNALRKEKPAACRNQRKEQRVGQGCCQECSNRAEKSTERAAREGRFGKCAMQLLLECTIGVTLLGAAGKPLHELERGGQPARAGGRCLVTMPSRRVRARKFRGRVEPPETCGRGGANWHPSQYPAPAGLRASANWGDCHDGGGGRPGSARRPVWCTARAGSGPSAGPGTVEARWGSRLGRVRPGRGPGLSGSEKRQPTGQVRPGRGPGHSRGEEKQPTGRRAAVTSTDQ